MTNRFDRDFEALQERQYEQTVETVTRSSRIDIVGAGVDEIDPPEDIDEFAEQAKTNAIARANLRKFVHDVWEPGYRVEGPDETVAFFEGEDDELDADPPEMTPEGGFLNNSAVLGGERYQDFYDFGKECSWQRWARGTVLVEYLKQDPDDPESMISGFNFIRPETVYPQVQNNTNILLPADPDDLPPDVDEGDITLTKRGEVAAYIQFDDESILGLRNNGFSEQDVPLSQNDVLKQTLEPDIGGDIQKGEGVFGTSAIEPVTEDITELEQMKRDRFEASQRKFYGIWTAQFAPETIDLGDNGVEIIEWEDDAISDTEGELNQMGPGDVLTTDAGIDLERHDGDVPDIDPVLMHYIKVISSALPTPLPLAVDFAGDINRDVTGNQKNGFEQTVSEARRYQETSWTHALRFIAERADLPTDGLKLKIQPEKESNPVKSLTDEEIGRMNTYISTLAEAAGPQAGPTALVDRESILEVMDFPEDQISPEDMAEQMADDEATEAAWRDVMMPDAGGVDAEALSEGEVDRIAESVVEALDWNPALHPRNPETGKFVERPYDVPDDITSLGTEQIVGELAAANDDFAEQVEGIAVDLPDDDGGNVPTEIQDLIADPNAGSGGSVGGITDIAFSEISEGDVIRANGKLIEVDEATEGITGETVRGHLYGESKTQSWNAANTTFESAGPIPESDSFPRTSIGSGETVAIRGLTQTEYGPKIKIDSPYSAKDAIKELEFDETHRSWNSQTETWDVDLDSLDAVLSKLQDGFKLQVNNEILREAGLGDRIES